MHLYEIQEKIISVQHDASLDYSETDIHDALSVCMSAAIESGEDLTKLSHDLELIQEQCKTNHSIDLNLFHEKIQTYTALKKGKSLLYKPDELRSIIDEINSIDERIVQFSQRRLHFFKPQFSQVRYSDRDSSNVSLLIHDTQMKLACFMGASFASSLHLIRDNTNLHTGFLSRVILSRSLLESCVHQLFVLRKINKLLSRIRNSEPKKTASELDLIPSLLQKSMYGTASPIHDTDQTVPGHHINKCIGTLDEPVNRISKHIFEEHYAHLCDFTHPNLGMRALMLDILPNAPGDYFCSAVKIAPDFGFSCKDPTQSDLLIRSLYMASTLLTESFNIYRDVQSQLTEKEQNNRELGQRANK